MTRVIAGPWKAATSALEAEYHPGHERAQGLEVVGPPAVRARDELDARRHGCARGHLRARVRRVPELGVEEGGVEGRDELASAPGAHRVQVEDDALGDDAGEGVEAHAPRRGPPRAVATPERHGGGR